MFTQVVQVAFLRYQTVALLALAVAVESAALTIAADIAADTTAETLMMESFIITASAVTSGRTSWRK